MTGLPDSSHMFMISASTHSPALLHVLPESAKISWKQIMAWNAHLIHGCSSASSVG